MTYFVEITLILRGDFHVELNSFSLLQKYFQALGLEFIDHGHTQPWRAD